MNDLTVENCRQRGPIKFQSLAQVLLGRDFVLALEQGAVNNFKSNSKKMIPWFSFLCVLAVK